jgi:hypothetical protein
MIAEREGETMKSERTSSLVAMAKARVFASEGWHVTLTASDGKVFAPAEFESFIEANWPSKPKIAETAKQA